MADWASDLAAFQTKAVTRMWYFAYGTDLHRHAVADWCKHVRRPLPRRDSVRPAVLLNHRLCFPVYDAFWNGGVADAVPETGKSISGALIELSNHGLETLERLGGVSHDRQSREDGQRRRVTVTVIPYAGGPPVEAITFRVLRSDTHHIPPTRVYMNRLIDAAVEVRLSAMWVMHLNTFAVREPAVRYEPPAPTPIEPPHFARPLVMPHRPRRELALAGVN